MYDENIHIMLPLIFSAAPAAAAIEADGGKKKGGNGSKRGWGPAAE